MIAEVLLVLAGHSSSLFPTDHHINPAFSPYLHPGEQQCLESLAQIAFRYRKVKQAAAKLSRSSSRYICSLCASLNDILRKEYETLVVETEARVLARDPYLVGKGSFVPLSSIRATFSEWDAPLTSLDVLMESLQLRQTWPPGVLIDLLLSRAETGIHRVASILSRLSQAVQRVWRNELSIFILYGTLSTSDPLASEDYTLIEDGIPACVSLQTRESIAYVGRAIGTVKKAKRHAQLPREMTEKHIKMLETVLPEDEYEFGRVIAGIRTDVSEWLWLNVLTQADVEEAVDSLANYFLLRNGEFGLSLIREIERLKLARLTTRSGPSGIIREQDLNLALLRASLGTSAQSDPSLSHLRFVLPTGPIRPLLPSLATGKKTSTSFSADALPTFDDLLLGTPLTLTYNVTWPLDIFLQPTDLHIYGVVFAYLSSLRKTQTRIHVCWAALSNAQRARRRWTGLGEGGTQEDLQARGELLRCGWGIVREMSWFLDVLLEYLMVDVVDVQFGNLKTQLRSSRLASMGGGGKAHGSDVGPSSVPSVSSNLGGLQASATPAHLDFTTLRDVHSIYLEHLLTGSLLANPALTSIIRSILEVCEHFTAQVERWGGDVLPALLFEGSIGTSDSVGRMVEERKAVVSAINETLHTLLQSFYDQLSQSTSQTTNPHDSVSFTMNTSLSGAYNPTMARLGIKRARRFEGDGETRRHIERLLLRLDFSGGFSKPRKVGSKGAEELILKQGGL